MSSLAGQTFAGYEVLAKLGEGGMGSVFKARQPTLNRLVALKVMAPQFCSDAMFVGRFRREANAAAALNHENIVQVFSAGESEGTHYIAMEFVEGITLRQHIDSHGKLDPREAIAITVYVAQALQYAWNKAKLIHRDIKPENIFLSNAGEVKVGDLGLAKSVGGETTSLTQTGMMMGSPNYISPEQARGLSDIDFRTDIYSLGCTLYHMLTGRTPYSGSDPLVVITKHVNDPPPAIFKVWPQCPVPLALVLGKMLTKKRNDRPASYEDLIAQLQGVHDKLKPAITIAPVSATGSARASDATPTPRPASATPTPKPSVVKTPTSVPAAKQTRWSSRFSVLRLDRLKPELQRTMLYATAGVAAVAVIAGAVWWFAGRAPTAQVDDAFVLEVAALPAEQQAARVVAKLKELNPDFNATTVKHKIENGVVVELSFSSNKMTDISPVAALKQLRVLDCNASSRTTSELRDFSPLRGLPLTQLKADWTGLSDLLPLSGLPLQKLSIQHTKVSDLSPLIGMPVSDLDLAGAPVNDITPLANLPLTRLHLHDCKAIRDLTPLRGRKITWLCFAGTQVEDVSPLRGMPIGGVVCNNDVLRSPQNLAVLRAISTLKNVNNKPAAKFWQQVDAGQLQATASTPEQEQATAAEQPRQTIDLLALTDAVNDRIMPRGLGKANIWERRGRSLVYVSDGKAGKVAPPVAIRARSYEIEVEFERLSGTGHFHVDLPLEDGRIVPIFLDYSGAKLIARRVGATWPAGRPGHGRFIVRLDRGANGAPDHITARLNDEALTDWQGDIAKFTVVPEPYPQFPGQPLTSIFCFSDSYEIRVWQLRVFDGEATVLRGAAATGDAGWQNAINLLPLVDTQKDAVAGEWTLENGELVGDKENPAVLEIPYQPPEEYDYRVEFTCRGNGGGSQHLVKGACNFVWRFCTNSGKTPNIFGFQLVNGKPIHDNPTKTELPTVERRGRHVSLVEVRNDGVRGWLDGKPVVAWKTDYADMGNDKKFKQRNSSLLGIGCQNRMIFHRIEVREVSGKGTFTRGGPNVQSSSNSYDGTYVAQSAKGEKIPHPLSRKTYDAVLPDGKTAAVPEGMVLVPAGPFTMGSDKNPAAHPPHEVYLNAFLMDRFEVTNAQYLEFVKATQHRMPPHWTKNGDRIPPGRENHPVGNVNWEDAKAYCDWCGKRLPTEAEWEKAASWDPVSKTKNRFPWGNEEDKDPALPRANWQVRWTDRGNDQKVWDAFTKTDKFKELMALGGMTMSVGSFPLGASWYKCHDMAGNVWEWTADWFDRYPGNDSKLNEETEAKCGQTHRAVRDATCGCHPLSSPILSCAGRSPQSPSWRVWHLGFRCAMDWPLKASSAATRQAALVMPADDAGWQNAINLLPLIDPQKDAVTGTWTFETGALVSSSSGNTPLEIPYQPSEEYDFRVEFSLETTGGAVVQRLSKSGQCFVWLMGGYGGRTFGFDSVSGQPASRNPTRQELNLQCGRRYISVVRVRNGQVTAFLDGSMITAWKTDYQDMGTPNWWKSRDQALLGVGSYNGRVVFHRIEVREVTGKGTFTRGAPAGAAGASASADALWQNAINLLPLVDLEKDRVSGTWTTANGELSANDVAAASQKVQTPYRPPEEYDCRVSFTTTGGMANVAVGLSAAGRSFVCLIKTNQSDHVMGFEAINKKAVLENSTAAHIPHLEQGRRYTMVVEVRKEGVTAYLDGQRMTAWKTDYRDMSPWAIWKFSDDTLLGIGCVKTTAVFHEMKVREVTGQGTFTRVASTGQSASASPASDAAWQNAINLLSLVDLLQDVNSGKWETAPDGLKATDIKSMSQKIQPPYRPPEEYDYRISFTPISGNADVAIGLTAKGRSFVFYMKKFANDHCLGFEAIGGKAIAAGPTAHRFPHLEMGSRYTVVVEVRKNGLRGYLDGKLVAEWATDYSDMSAWPVWKFKDDTLPGFGCSLSTAVFQEVKLREVTGKGMFTRGAPKP